MAKKQVGVWGGIWFGASLRVIAEVGTRRSRHQWSGTGRAPYASGCTPPCPPTSDTLTSAALVKEANLAFILNTHLFSLIDPPAPKSKEPRYYEKLQAKRAAEEAAKPRKTFAEHLITLAYVTFSVLLGMLLFHVVWPTARPHAIRYGTPVWERFGAPWFYGSFVPWWNESFVPWWDNHAAPLLARQMANSRRALL